MALFSPKEYSLAEAIVHLSTRNPFLPERIEAEKAVLGDDHRPVEDVWSVHQDRPEESPNVRAIADRADALARDIAGRVRRGATPSAREAALLENLALYVLYERSQRRLNEDAPRAHLGRGRKSFGPLFAALERDLRELAGPAGSRQEPALLFALFFQVHRAFQHIFRCLVGRSLPVARLRAATWESIFTHDIERYFRSLFRRMTDLNTLVTGPSGTGKELVARAIGLSLFIPYDPKSHSFAADPGAGFHAVNLSALTPTLIESELFGHRRGAFTGALEDRDGWFAACGEHGAVFLDEIAEVDPSIQVKLLRVLESRSFFRLGGRRPRSFTGKLVAATNRDPEEEMRAGRFREDLYYRLCSDRIVTPSLREQLEDDPEELLHLVRFVVRRVAGEGEDALVDLVISWIDRRLGRDYPWPGNFRELEQCVRNLMVRGKYRPASPAGPSGADLAGEVLAGRLTAEELLRRYVTLVYAREGTYEGAARRLGLDRRTVKRKVDPKLLAGKTGPDPLSRGGRRG